LAAQYGYTELAETVWKVNMDPDAATHQELEKLWDAMNSPQWGQMSTNERIPTLRQLQLAFKLLQDQKENALTAWWVKETLTFLREIGDNEEAPLNERQLAKVILQQLLNQITPVGLPVTGNWTTIPKSL
jgi:hypothetical protein